MDSETIPMDNAEAEIADAWDREGFHPVDTQDPEEAEALGDTPESSTQPEEPTQRFTLKNRDEVREVSREELIAMAQKGWDYDTVRQERDQLRQYRDFVRQRELTGRGMDEQTAWKAVRREGRGGLSAEELTRMESAEIRQRDMETFLDLYADVKPDAIPREVWADVAGGESLVNAYTRYRNRQLSTELAAERQNRENRQITPGSLSKSAGQDLSEQDRIWYSED